MKRATGIYLILITAVFMLVVSGCGKNTPKETISVTSAAAGSTTSAETAETQAAAQQIMNDKPVFLYYMDYAEDEAERIKTFSAEWTTEEDLGVFAALARDGGSFDFIEEYGSEIGMQQGTWDTVNTSTDYKIGYEISFTVAGESRIYTILEPADVADSEDLFMGDYDTDEITGYLGIWLYDDYHQDGGFYDHVDPDEYDADTLLTSIKLRPTPQSSEINDLVLRAFSYSSSLEFDEDGHYNNSYSCEVRIERD